jgi:hypothetical protein
MEHVIRLLDDLEDSIATTVFRLKRALTWTPRERRRETRLKAAATAP